MRVLLRTRRDMEDIHTWATLDRVRLLEAAVKMAKPIIKDVSKEICNHDATEYVPCACEAKRALQAIEEAIAK